MARSEQRTVRVDDQVRIVAEAFGAPDDPALLLIGGATWSMDWWDDELCDRLAARGRLVLRYDQRDTGGSTSCPPGAPAYSSADLVTDALAVLDGFDVAQAHVVGLSMGGGLSQRLALEHRNRVATLTLISTTPIDPVENLPAPAPEIQALFAGETPEPAWDDREAVIDHIVEGERPFAGPGKLRRGAGQEHRGTGGRPHRLTSPRA